MSVHSRRKKHHPLRRVYSSARTSIVKDSTTITNSTIPQTAYQDDRSYWDKLGYGELEVFLLGDYTIT